MNAIPVSTAKKETVTLTLGKRSYEVALTLNLIEEIQKSTEGGLDGVFKNIGEIGYLKWLIAKLVNEAVDAHNDESDEKWEYVTEGYVGRKITYNGIQDITRVVFACFGASLPDGEKVTGEDISDEMKQELEDIPENEKN